MAHVGTYFPQVRSDVMLLDMLSQACLAEGKAYKNKMQQMINIYSLEIIINS